MNKDKSMHEKWTFGLQGLACGVDQGSPFTASSCSLQIQKWPSTAKKVKLRFRQRPLDCAVGGRERGSPYKGYEDEKEDISDIQGGGK